MANHLTPTELAREAGLERRDVIVKCVELGVPIFNGRIDKTLFLSSLRELPGRSRCSQTQRLAPPLSVSGALGGPDALAGLERTLRPRRLKRTAGRPRPRLGPLLLSGLTQQRRGGLLEDLSPRASRLALGLEVLDHLADPGR